MADKYYLGSTGDGTPIGHVIMYMGVTAPDRYLACDGAVYKITDYPSLAEHFKTQFGSSNYFGGDGTTTFAVPDGRGEFVRGVDTGKIRDPEGDTRGVGKHQDATTITAFQYRMDGSNTYMQIQADDVREAWHTPKDYDKATLVKTYANTQRLTMTATEYTENLPSDYTARPTNINVLFCIKAK